MLCVAQIVFFIETYSYIYSTLLYENTLMTLHPVKKLQQRSIGSYMKLRIHEALEDFFANWFQHQEQEILRE